MRKPGQQVTAGRLGNAREFPDQMFRAGHGQIQHTDIVDQFQRIATIADGHKDYLQGMIECYMTRASTKMTVTVSTPAHWRALTVLLVVMLVMSAIPLVWPRRKDGGNRPASEHQQITHAGSSAASMPVSMPKPPTEPSRISQPGRPTAGPHPLGGMCARSVRPG